ncbi:MAG TPA: 50S ribosomal protein L4, partial [Anaerolineae bacterium]|nr:50S ribosomal protein L4 [Anaerolineae bacterium]
QGSTRAPHWRGGGVVFGPTPRSYEQKMPRKMRRVAMRSALSAKAGNAQLIVVQDLALAQPKTKEMVTVLRNLKAEQSALILLPQRNANVELSARNLPDVKALQAGYLNMRDLLGYRTLVVTTDAISEIERILG